MNPLRKAWDRIVDVVEGEDAPGGIVYDPVHVAGVLAGCLCAFGALFWLLWSLLVFEGGLFAKVVPALQVLFTDKRLADVGYGGYPSQMGPFEGWAVNLAALALTAALACGVRRMFRRREKK